MESEPKESRMPRRGVAMIVVLSMIVFFSMLGYMGIEMAGRDTQVAGTYLDITSRDVANRSALQLGLSRLNADANRTAAQLQQFVADSSKPLANTHRFLNLAQPTCSLQVEDPGFHALGTEGDQSAVKVQVLSADLGSSVSGSGSGDGIRLTLLVTGRGRNGDVASSISSYQIYGLDVPASSAGAPSLDNAIYVNGSLPNTNVGNQVTGNMYVAGSVLLNGPASIAVSGKLRVNGSFTSNAPVTAAENAVIGGDLYTNASAPMTFQKNLVIKGGFQAMNANLVVAGNVEVQSTPAAAGSWNSTASLLVGGQYWEKAMCHEFGGRVRILGDAFFDNCLMVNTSGVVDTFSNLYIARNGGTSTSDLKGGTFLIRGDLGSWATGGKFQNQSGAPTTITGNLLLKQPLDIGGQINVPSGAIQLWAGIADIRMNSPSALNGGTSTYLKATNQRGNFSGGVTLNGPLTTAGTLDAGFSNTTGNPRWSISAGAASKTWLYENGSAFSSVAQDPRLANASSSNASGFRSTGTLPVPSDLFTAPVPVAATAYATNPFTAEDLDLDPSKSWNQVYTVDSSKLKAIWIDLTDAAIAAAGAAGSNWTISDWNKIYNKYKRADGWLIARFPGTCNMGNLNAPGGTFAGKAIWIVEKSINVNGNWPGTTSSSDIQMIYVRGAASLGAFGSPSSFNGYIHFENPFTGQMMWGYGTSTVTLTGALHLKGSPTNLTGNGGNTLRVVGSQSVMDQLQAAVPGLLGAPSPGWTAPAENPTAPAPIVYPVAASTNRIVVRQPVLRFNPWGFYR